MQTNPLFEAVINNDEAAIRKLKNSAWANKTNELGYSPVEIAKLLNRTKALVLLDRPLPFIPVKTVLQSGKTVFLDLHQLESTFKFKYLPYLTFDNYQHLQFAASNYPRLFRWRWLTWDNHQWGEKYREQFFTCSQVNVSIEWINKEIGYGAFMQEALPADSFVMEYTGHFRPYSQEETIFQNAYCFQYPMRNSVSGIYVVDSLTGGNLSRFINHATKPTLKALCAFDRGLIHIVLITTRAIEKGEELTFDYGRDYWQRRNN